MEEQFDACVCTCVTGTTEREIRPELVCTCVCVCVELCRSDDAGVFTEAWSTNKGGM